MRRYTCQAYLVEADEVKLATDVNPLRADTEDAKVFETSLRIHDSRRHGRRQGRGYRDGDDVQRLDDDGFGGNLQVQDILKVNTTMYSLFLRKSGAEQSIKIRTQLNTAVIQIASGSRKKQYI